MANQFNTTELDFDNIKQNLINYFKRSGGPFKDWDFAGSGLNNLLDVLAYNTHYNAVNSHMAMNESFLDSAQVRANVVSRAKLLGYTPTSKTGAIATINIQLTRKSNNFNTTYTLQKGTRLRSTVEGVTYNFIVTTSAAANLGANNTFSFINVPIKQVDIKLESFLVDGSQDNQKFVIADKDVDTSTLVVKVYDNMSTTNYRTYSLFESFDGLTSESEVYFLYENMNGNYEVEFGNGTFGKKPNNAGRIVLEYGITQGAVANGASLFRWAERGENLVSEQAVTTVSAASGGSEKETLDSIRFTAPLSFISQDRAVTSSDYKSLLLKNISGIKDIVAWGGELEDRPQFGKVFLAFKPEGAELMTAAQKTEVLDYIQGKKLVTMDVQIVDPTYTYLYFDVNFRYNPTFSSLSAGEYEILIREKIKLFNEVNLNRFDGIFRHSKFLNSIDLTDTAILSSSSNVKAYKKLTVSNTRADIQSIKFNFELEGDMNQNNSMITTTLFQDNDGKQVRVGDRFISNLNYRQLYTYTTDNAGREVVIKPNIGYMYPDTGEIAIDNLNLSATTDILFFVESKNKDVLTNKRNILTIDLNYCNFTAIQDTGTVQSSGATAVGGVPGSSTSYSGSGY
jgi:hypothetical protein